MRTKIEVGYLTLFHITVAALLAMLLLSSAGCSTGHISINKEDQAKRASRVALQESRQAYVESHQTAPRIAQAILFGQSVVGMSREEVHILRGEEFASKQREGEDLLGSWVYEHWYQDWDHAPPQVVYIPEEILFYRNNKLVDITRP